jgi:hypothetical protein
VRLVSKCHGREVREEDRDVAIKRKDAIVKQVSWKGIQGRRQRYCTQYMEEVRASRQRERSMQRASGISI